MPRLSTYVFCASMMLFAGTAIAAPKVLIETSLGDITVDLDAERAPSTVENFLAYVDADSYDGTIFHRVIDGFMIQGGGFDESYDRRPSRAPIDNEATNGLSNDLGTIAMARTSDPHSATNQFFINVADNDFLNHREETQRGWGYTVFGRVVDGMSVVDEIRQVQTASGGPFSKDVPTTPVVIRDIRVVE